MNMAAQSRKPLVKLLSLTLLALPAPTLAEEFLCDATQASTQSLPQLDASCPVGQGLWGNQKPKGQQSQFWIQCGVYSQPLSLSEAKVLYQKISTDVWLKAEAKAFRCLIGPYQDLKLARSELSQVKQAPGYKEAFLREIVKGLPLSQTEYTPKSKLKPKPQPKLEPAPINAPVLTVAEAPKQSRVERPNQSTGDVSVRLNARVDGVQYQVSYFRSSDDQFYMEHDLPWNRMNYEQAYKSCYRQGLRLAKPAEWQALLDSGVMVKDNWPMHLPYWGAEKTGLFYSGKVNQLKGSSLLNVMCVK